MEDSLKNKNILFLTHSYHSFQKDPIELAAKSFRHVYVLVRYKPIAEISNIIPISFFKPHRKKYAIQDQDLPKNVTVIAVPLWYLPTKAGYSALGEKHVQSTIRVIKKYHVEFDLMHAHLTWTAGYVAARLKELYKKPYVLTVHEEDGTLKEEIEGSDSSRIFWAWEQADILQRVNKKTLDILKKYNSKAMYMSPGFNSKYFYPKDMAECRRKLGLSEKRKIILNIGNLEEYKGHTYLVDAVNKLVKAGNDLLCIVMGEGSKRTELEKKVKSLGLQNNMVFIGGKPHSEVADWINASDAFVMSSLGEGTPGVMYEALGCGKPFAGTNVSGIPEIIISDDLGYLCDSKDPDGLAGVITKTLDKKWDSDYIVKYISKYSIENLNGVLLNCYREII